MLFLRQARSVIALDTSSHVSILNTLRASSYGEGANAKVRPNSLLHIDDNMPSPSLYGLNEVYQNHL